MQLAVKARKSEVKKRLVREREVVEKVISLRWSLLESASEGEVDEVRALVRQGVDIECTGKDLDSPLAEACGFGFEDMVGGTIAPGSIASPRH